MCADIQRNERHWTHTEQGSGYWSNNTQGRIWWIHTQSYITLMPNKQQSPHISLSDSDIFLHCYLCSQSQRGLPNKGYPEQRKEDEGSSCCVLQAVRSRWGTGRRGLDFTGSTPTCDLCHDLCHVSSLICLPLGILCIHLLISKERHEDNVR